MNKMFLDQTPGFFYFISFLGQKKLFECSHSFPLHLLYCYILWHHTALPRRSLWCHEKGLRSSRRCDTERKCLCVFKHYGNCKRAFQSCQEYMLWKDECLCGINSSCYTRALECVVFSHCSLEPSISNGIWHTPHQMLNEAFPSWGVCVFWVLCVTSAGSLCGGLVGAVLIFWRDSPGPGTAHPRVGANRGVGMAPSSPCIPVSPAEMSFWVCIWRVFLGNVM